MLKRGLLLNYFIKHKFLMLTGLVSLVLISCLEAVLPLLIKKAIDSFSGKPEVHELQVIALEYLCVALLLMVFRIGWRVPFAITSARVGMDLRKKYVEHLLKLPKGFFQGKKTGELTALGSSDTEAIRQLYDMGSVIIIDAVCGLIIPPLVMFYLNPKLAAILLVPLLGIPILTYFFDRRIQKNYHAAQKSVSALYGHLQESLEGILLIKSFTKEHSLLKRFDMTSRAYIEKNLKLSKVESLFAPSLDIFVAISLLIHIIYGGSLVIEGALSLGTFVAFMRYLNMLSWPMKAVGLAVTMVQKAKVSAERLETVLNHPAERDGGLAPEGKSSGSLLSFKNVSFTFPGAAAPALKNISFDINEGEKVALLGDIGSGKSVLLSLIPRLQNVSEGEIIFKGVNVEDWDKAGLRSEVSYVPQDVFLFNRTVRENILFGNQSISSLEAEGLGAVEEAASKAAILHEIHNMPFGFESMLGERGINISGGQKQRVSIARALIKPSSLLIFDDALSAVDLESEQQILNALDENKLQSTSIYSGQRVSVVKHVDKVIVLRHGEVIQIGTPNELLNDKSGWFYNFYEEQKIEEGLNEKPA